MSARWRDLARLAWRDSRTARRRLLLFMSSISIGVAVLVAVDGYSANVVRSIREQSRALLGGDLSLTARRPFPAPIDSLLDSLARAGVTAGRVTTFASMALIPRTGATRLVQVRAVDPGVPFYGHIGSTPAGRYPMIQAEHGALVDSSLFTELGARVGDTLALGAARFIILGALRDVPGDVGIASALGPRVYIARRWVPETKLLVFGSRAEHEALLQLPPGMDPAQVVASHRATLTASSVRARTARDTERSLTEGVNQLDRFLGVVGLIALLLGGIGVASAIRAYVEEKHDVIAVLRCLGATAPQVLAVFLMETTALGFAGALIGAALGVGAQLALPHVLGGFMPVDVHPSLVPSALAAGVAVGVWVSAAFALLPLLGVRRISPLAVLRRDAPDAPARGFLRDAPRLATGAALAASLVVIAIARAGTVRRGLGMSAGVAAAIILLWLAAVVVRGGARRLLRARWPFVVRQGIANLYRPANQTRAVILALGFGAFLLGTLYLVQRNLLARLALGSAETQANLAFFDVQPDQVRGVDSVIRAAHLPVLQQVPIVPMRIAAIDGRDASTLVLQHHAWALRREYRSTYRDTLVASEVLTAGRWLRPTPAGGLPEISVEQDVANDLGLVLGDTVTWDVQGVRIPTVVTSFRKVNFARFEPNFFVVFIPGALRDAPQTTVFLSRAPSAAARAAVQRSVVQGFPNVSSIDLAQIQQAIGSILDRIALAVRFLALFSVATGALVMASAIAASRRQRLREGVLLKTLGATRAQIGRIMLSEYAVLGAMGSVTGALLAVAGAWALMRFVFHAPFAVASVPLLAIALAMMLLTVAIGLWSSRDVFRETAMSALRNQG